MINQKTTTVEVPIRGMDCSGCIKHVYDAIKELDGVESVDVFLSSEKAVINLNPKKVDLDAISKAVEGAGYSVPKQDTQKPSNPSFDDVTKPVLTLFGVVLGAVLFIAVVGEWLGLFEAFTARVPEPTSTGMDSPVIAA